MIDTRINISNLSRLWAVSDQLVPHLGVFDDLDLFAGVYDDRRDCPRAIPTQVFDGIAIVPIQGLIWKERRQVLADIFSGEPIGISCEEIAAMLSWALNDEGVTGILLDVCSSGGMVDGVADLAKILHEAAADKPLIAQISDHCHSGALWLASQCNTIYANETAFVGSLGVYSVAHDSSRFVNEKLKTTVHVFRAGKLKGAGTPGTKITDEQLQSFQRRVDSVYDVMLKHIARGYGVSQAAARKLCDGDVHVGRQAVAAGLVDAIATFNQTLDEMIAEYTHGQRARARTQPAAKSTSAHRSEITNPQPPQSKGPKPMNVKEAIAKFRKAVTDERESSKCTQAAAVRIVAQRDPDLHTAYLKATNNPAVHGLIDGRRKMATSVIG